MKPIVSKLILLLLMTTSTHLYAERGAAAFDKGLDGAVRFYEVICPDQKRTTITHDIQTKETCGMHVNDNFREECKVNWDIDDAAKAICK